MRRHKYLSILSIAATLLFLLGANAPHAKSDSNALSLEELYGLSYPKNFKDDPSFNLSKLRHSAMQEAALSIGAQNGYVSEFSNLEDAIRSVSRELDKLFDFNTVMRLASTDDGELYLLPPVITEANDVITASENYRELRVSGKIYNIVERERLVGLAPNWRAYLFSGESVSLQQPISSLFPKDDDERNLWRDWINQGWAAGANQAQREMQSRIRRLGQDYIGMVRYMTLVEEGKISQTVLAKVEQNVIGDNDHMRINDKLYRITIPASLNTKDEEWNALSLDPRGSLMYPGEHNSKP